MENYKLSKPKLRPMLVVTPRSRLVASHFGVCTLSIAVTLAILNVHPIIGMICLFIALYCGFILLVGLLGKIILNSRSEK